MILSELNHILFFLRKLYIFWSLRRKIAIKPTLAFWFIYVDLS